MSRERDEEREENPGPEGPLPGICTALILQSPVSTWIADRDGTNIFENEAARRLFGIERDEEVVGKYNIFEDDVLIAGGFMPQIRKVFEEGGSTEIVGDYDFSQVKHVQVNAPTHKILRVFLFAIKDQDGRVRNVIVQHEDWTDRVRAEKALQSSEAQYRQLVEEISDWVWEVDVEGRYTYASPAVERLLGYTPEEVVGKSPFDFIAPESQQVVTEEFESAIGERREIVRFLNLNIRKDGSPRYLETSARPVFDSAGSLTGYRGVDRDITDRIRTEEALARSEARYREMAEGISDWMWEVDTEGRCTYSNPVIESILGYKPEEVIGKPIMEFILPEYREEAAGLIRQAVAEGREIVGSVTGERHKDGSIRYLETNAKPMLDESGSLAGFRGMHRDVTARVEAERALEAEKERFRALIENASDVITVIDTDGITRYVSPSVERVLGYDPEELIGRSAFDQVHPDDVAKDKWRFEELARHEGMVEFGGEFRVRHRDGSWRTFEAVFQNLLGNPAIRGIVVNQRDITERKQAEEALRESNEQLQTIIATSPLAIVTLDLDGKVTSWNPAAENMFGWAAQEVIGKPMPNLPDDQLPVLRELIQRLLRGEVLNGEEVPHVRKDGTRVEISVSVAALHDSTGAIVGFMGMLADITERKRAEEALRESEERYRQLVEMMNEGLASVNKDYLFTYVNQKFADMLAYYPEEMIGRFMLDFVREDARSVLEYQMARRKRGEAENFELAWNSKDGRTVYTLVSPRPVFDDAGNFAGSVAVITDVTERERAEQSLKEREEWFRSVLQHLSDIIWVVDEALNIKYASPSCELVLGYRPEDLVGKNGMEFVHPDDLQIVRREFEEVVTKENTFIPTEFRVRHAEGRWIWLEAVGNNMLEHPAIRGIIITARGITERKQAEEELKESEERFRALTENSSDIIMVANAEGNIMYVSPAVEHILGFTPDEMIGTPIFDHVHPDDAARGRPTFRELAQHEGMIESGLEFRLRDRGGSWHIMEVTVKNMLNDPAVAGITINHRDITDRVEAERRAMEFEEHRKEFYRKTIEAATEGKLVITEADEIKKIAGKPIAKWEIKGGEDLSFIRQAIADAARSAGMDEDRVCDFILAVGELTTNAYKHAGGGKTSLHRVNDSLMVVVSDKGKGMEALSLPEVALVRGYSTAGSLGMGYKAVLSISDKAFLATGPTGTTAAIEMGIHPAESPAVVANLPDTWKTI